MHSGEVIGTGSYLLGPASDTQQAYSSVKVLYEHFGGCNEPWLGFLLKRRCAAQQAGDGIEKI
jgi:hypothetical protein